MTDEKLAPTHQVAGPLVLAPHMVPTRRGVFSFLSSIEREGRWTLPRFFRALAVLGNVEVDLSDAELGQESDIEVFCLLGNVSIKVPHVLRLEVDGSATIGSFEVRGQTTRASDQTSPLVRIKAHGILGSIEVIVVDPNKKSFLERFTARWKMRDADAD